MQLLPIIAPPATPSTPPAPTEKTESKTNANAEEKNAPKKQVQVRSDRERLKGCLPGFNVVDEPSSKQSDAAVMAMQLRAQVILRIPGYAFFFKIFYLAQTYLPSFTSLVQDALPQHG